MWDLETIIRMNNEAQEAFEKKNAYEAHQRQEAQGIKRICEQEVAIFDGASYVRSVYNGSLDGRASQGKTGEELS
tara:strand:- start:7624 stop:7848 length:225 start_codon:yes stop_codon:yes gene_type:complete